MIYVPAQYHTCTCMLNNSSDFVRLATALFLSFKLQLPTSDNTEITASGPKNTLEGPVPVDNPQRKKIIP